MLMFIRDSRRSYKTYSFPELILITNLCLFGTPVGVTELILKLHSSHLFRDTRGYHGDYGTYTYFTDTGVLVNTTELIQDLYLFYAYGSTRKYYRAYTGLILILRIWEYS